MIGQQYIDGQWLSGSGPELRRESPATGRETWRGCAATHKQVQQAIVAAHRAGGGGEGGTKGWAATDFAQRAEIIERFARHVASRRPELIEAISEEAGKPRWESATEVDAMIAKVAISRQAHDERRTATVHEKGGVRTATRYKPHGVLAVLGPFNFPGHVPNGHIVPALLAGNTVVFKPSELTPLVGELMVRCWEEAGLPTGVISLVQGGRELGAALAGATAIDGILFTGSRAAGEAISAALARQPEKILALEMGGNNPLIAWDAADAEAAAYLIVQSAFLTAGQRCTCARRLIIPAGSAGEPMLDRLVEMTGRLVVGPHTQTPEPFMGSLITPAAAERMLAAQDSLLNHGARALLPMRRIGDGGAFLTAGILDVTAMKSRADEELFGPLLQVIRVNDFPAALAEANNTRFGLVAGLISDHRARYDEFFTHIRAGLVNWNRPTTGASSALPFGGVGLSGNHRPAGYFAADYCSYPIASLEMLRAELPSQLTPGVLL